MQNVGGCGWRWVMCVQGKGAARTALNDFTDDALTILGYNYSKMGQP